jgi:HAD superfamily hydrolase (TIGR01509 family)
MPHVAQLSEDSDVGRRVSGRRRDIFKTRYLPHLRPFARTRDLVERLLDDGFAVVVASSAKQDELRELLEIAGVADLIQSHTSSDDAERSKPDPDIVAAALKESGARPGTAIMLGDTPYDVEASQRAGVACVAVESGGWGRADLAGAVEVYAGVSDLLERYDRSPFARLAAAARREPARPRATASAWSIAAPLLVLGLALIAGAAWRRRPRADRDRGWNDDRDRAIRRRRLTARDREALRRLIERTS